MYTTVSHASVLSRCLGVSKESVTVQLMCTLLQYFFNPTLDHLNFVATQMSDFIVGHYISCGDESLKEADFTSMAGC